MGAPTCPSALAPPGVPSTDAAASDAGALLPLRAMVTPAPVACISSSSLLAGGNEVLIEHHGALYRLKQTALGKLILTK
jgi:hemin uptake protein HemP